MTSFFEFQLKVGGVLALGVLMYLLFLSRDTSFNRNRVWLLGCLFGPWIVPLIAMPFQLKEFLFGKTLPVQEFVVTNYVSEPVIVPVLQTNVLSRETILVSLFVLMAVALLFRLGMGCFSVLKLRNASIKGKYKGLGLRLFKNVGIVPFSFFRTIYASNKIQNQQDYHLILDHELTHCKQLHSIDIIFAELILLLQWWNPFAWWLRKLIAQNHEYCVDSSMLKKVSEPSTYQYLLVNLLSGNASLQLVNSFNGSFTKKRIVMMNKNNSNHIINRLKIAPVFVVLVLAGSAFTNADKTVVPTVFETLEIPNLVEETKKDSVVVSKTITVEDKTSNTKVEEVISVIGYSAKDSIVIKQQGNLELHGEPHIKIVKKGDVPMVLLDGKESSVEVLNDLDPTKVKNIFVIKGHEALQVSTGDKVKHDVIVVNSKEENEEKFSIVINDSLATKNNNKVRIKLSSLENEDAPLIIIDGKECTLQELNKLDQTKIKSINVTKTGDEVVKLGEKAKHGIVKVVMLRDYEDADVLIKYDNSKYGTPSKRKMKHKFKLSKGEKMPVFYIDDKEVSQEEVANIDANTIASFSVLKEESATKLYGSEGKNGVVLITLKK